MEFDINESTKTESMLFQPSFLISKHTRELDSMYQEHERKSKYLGYAILAVSIVIGVVYNIYAVTIARRIK